MVVIHSIEISTLLLIPWYGSRPRLQSGVRQSVSLTNEIPVITRQLVVVTTSIQQYVLNP